MQLPHSSKSTYMVFISFQMHYIHIALAPKYLSDCVSTVSAASGRYRLRSTGSEAYILPRTRTRFGEGGFFYAGPVAWNTLLSDLHDITDTSTFRKRLKNVLFNRAFNWFCWRSWTCRIVAPYKFCVDWLIDQPAVWYVRQIYQFTLSHKTSSPHITLLGWLGGTCVCVSNDFARAVML